MTIRVLLVDDQALFREGLNTLLSVRDNIEIVGEADNGEEAIRVVASGDAFILGKLGVRDRTQAALKAKELGLI